MPSIQLSQQDAEFVEEQMNSGLYESADAVITAGLALLREQEKATLRMLIQEGIDDVEAGRVHTYENAEAFLADMKRMFEDAREP